MSNHILITPFLYFLDEITPEEEEGKLLPVDKCLTIVKLDTLFMQTEMCCYVQANSLK